MLKLWSPNNALNANVEGNYTCCRVESVSWWTSTSRFDVFAYFMGRHDTMSTKKQAQEAWQWVVEMSGLWLKKNVKWIVKLQLTHWAVRQVGHVLWTLASFIPSIGWAFPWSRPFLPIWVFSSLHIVLISSLGSLRCKLDLCWLRQSWMMLLQC